MDGDNTDCSSLRKALVWYADEAKSLAKNLTGGGASNEAVLASVTVLALDAGRRADAALLQSRPDASSVELHPRTADLVRRFSAALAEKLSAAEEKYDYGDGWASPDWMDQCRRQLMEHIAKGDPRDVAAYCAFLWHHGEPTSRPTEDEHQQALRDAEAALQESRPAAAGRSASPERVP
jgi:hypothetical protein